MTSFPLFYSTELDDFAMTYEHFMNAQEMLKCSEKHPVSRANNGNTKQDAREAMRVVFSVLTKLICMHKKKFFMNIFKYYF